MKNKKIRTVIVGLGHMGFGYDLNSPNNFAMTHFRAVNQNKKFELVALIDANKDVLKKIDCKKTVLKLASVAELPQDVFFDLVIISTPTTSHLNVVKDLCKHPVNAILLEKPIASSLKDAQKIGEITRKAKIRSRVNFYLPQYAQFKSFKKNYDKNLWGDFLQGRVLFSRGVNNNGSHMIHFCLNLLGEPKRIEVLGKKVKTPGLSDFNRSFVFHYQYGSIHFVCASDHQNALGEIDLQFSKGRLRVTDQYSRWIESKIVQNKMFGIYGVEQLVRDELLPVHQMQSLVLKDLENHFDQPVVWKTDWEMALKTQKLVQKILDQ